jgi:D-beta-D-heptose 7-phosphate kinase / D-beta-D-heptose 1-phosphate adenosyltransferase
MKEHKQYGLAITIGVFDMLHAGHINLFRQMKARADRILVLVHDDSSTFENKSKFPVQEVQHRVRNIYQTKLADYVMIVYQADPSEKMKEILKHPEFVSRTLVYVRGDDWQDFPARKVIEGAKIPIEFVEYTKGVSSTQLRDEISKRV